MGYPRVGFLSFAQEHQSSEWQMCHTAVPSKWVTHPWMMVKIFLQCQ